MPHQLKTQSPFRDPPGSVPVSSAINAIFLVPLYKVIVPILRKYSSHHRSLTSLQRIGVGLVFAILTFVVAALVDRKHLNYANPSSMSAFWLVPQFYLTGVSEVFIYVGQLEFFYDKATDGTRSISNTLFLAEIGVGSSLGTGVVKIVEYVMGGIEKGWFTNNLNQGRLDLYYCLLTMINAVNLMVYLVVSYYHKRRDHGWMGRSVREESVIEMPAGGQNESMAI